MAGREIFWMVFGGYQTTPSRVHKSRSEAQGEATRLCKKHRVTFWVLETVDIVELEDPPVKVIDLQLPF